MTRKTALTPDQVRQRFRQRGQTLTQWAAERGYDRKAVYRVMAGQDKAHYGRAHEIAVALGLKVPDAEPSTAHAERNPQTRAAA
jgi:gp16 family phage-associated protein